MLRNLSEKCGAKFPVTTLSYSMVKIACLHDTFSENFELEARPVKGQSLPQKDKGRRRKGEKRLEPKKPKDLVTNFDFCAYPSKNVVKRSASGKKAMLSCCKCLFE